MGFTHLQIEQNHWLGGYRPQIPVLSALCSQMNLLNPWLPPPPNKIPGYTTVLRVLCPLRRPVSAMNCALLKDRNLALVSRQGPEISFWACLWADACCILWHKFRYLKFHKENSSCLCVLLFQLLNQIPENLEWKILRWRSPCCTLFSSNTTWWLEKLVRWM
jgi:hypothetical protein